MIPPVKVPSQSLVVITHLSLQSAPLRPPGQLPAISNRISLSTGHLGVLDLDGQTMR